MRNQILKHANLAVACFVALFLSVSAAALADRSSARSIAADTTFGLRDYFKPERTVERCEVVKGGRLAVAGAFAPAIPSPKRWGSRNRIATSIIKRPLRHSSKSALGWHRQPAPGYFPIATAFGDDGSFHQLTLIDRTANPAGQLYELRKTNSYGRAVRSFSKDGKLQLRAPEIQYGAIIQTVRLLATRDGGVIVAYYAGTSLHVLRYEADGTFADWGTAGTASITAMNPINSLPPSMRVPLAETADGGLLVTANIENRDALVKLDAKGSVDTAFGTGGHWLPPAPDAPDAGAASTATRIGGVSVSRSGRIAVLYAKQQTYELGTVSTFHTALLESDGSDQVLSPPLGSYSDGGDGGFPSVSPSDFKLTPTGVVVAFADTFYPNDTYRLNVARWIPESLLPPSVRSAGVYSKRFGVGSFAIADSGDLIYACGSRGMTDRKSKRAKHLGVRRIGI